MATTSSGPKKSFDDIMAAVEKAGGARARATHSICLDAEVARQIADLDAEYEAAVADEERATEGADGESKKSSRRMNAPSRSEQIASERDAIVDANPDAFYDITVQSARLHEWSELQAEHPPVEGNANDDAIGVHWVDFIPAAVRMCLVDPEPTDKVLAFFEENLTPFEWDRLGMAVLGVNGTRRDRPKSRRAISTRKNSGASSK